MRQGFLKNGPAPAAWALLRNMLEMQILSPYPHPTVSADGAQQRMVPQPLAFMHNQVQ